MSKVVDINERRDAFFTQGQRVRYSKTILEHGVADENASRNVVDVIEKQVCEDIVASARRVAKIAGHKIGKKLFRLVSSR